MILFASGAEAPKKKRSFYRSAKSAAPPKKNLPPKKQFITQKLVS
jgi:hypothetical protein